jgi:hypothetical protein
LPVAGFHGAGEKGVSAQRVCSCKSGSLLRAFAGGVLCGESQTRRTGGS